MGESDTKGKPKDSGSDPSSDTDAQREKLREQIRRLMKGGELSSEPENESSAERSTGALEHRADVGEPESQAAGRSSGPGKKTYGVEEDEFFGNDSDENEEADMDDS